jgi:hypothetical protein
MKKSLFALISLLIMGMSQAWAQTLNLDVTQENIATTICVPGWTATVRPPVAFTNKIKKALMLQKHLDWATNYQYELDHIEPLALGGAPSDKNNLMLQPWSEAHVKDALESKYHKLVCDGKLTLAQGRACFLKDWHTCK